MQLIPNFRIILMVIFINQCLCIAPTPPREPRVDKNIEATSLDENLIPASSILSNVDKWSITKINTKRQVFSWTIINFSLNGKKSGEYIESPVFTESSNSDYKWRLKLYPNGYENERIQTTTMRSNRRSYDYGYNYPYYTTTTQSPYSQNNNNEYMALHLSLESTNNPLTISSKIGLLNNKDELYFPNDIYVGTISSSDNSNIKKYFNNFVKKDYVMDKTNNLLIHDKLTIVVEIVINTGETNSTGNCGSPLEESNNAQIDNFENLLEDELFSDITFKIKNYEFKAHRAIVASVSSVFLDKFKKLQETNETVLEIDDVEPKIFKEILRYAYTRKVEKIEKVAQKLLPLAQQYNIKQLKSMCERVLCQNLNSDNALDFLQIATKSSATYLKMQALKYISTHAQNMIDNPSFTSLVAEPENLISIIQSLIKNSSS